MRIIEENAMMRRLKLTAERLVQLIPTANCVDRGKEADQDDPEQFWIVREFDDGQRQVYCRQCAESEGIWE